MQHMWPPLYVVLAAFAEFSHWVAYEIIALTMGWITARYRGRLRLAPFIVFFKSFIRWCGRTHLMMFCTLFWGGYWYMAYVIVSVLSAFITLAALYVVWVNRREIAEVLRIG